MADAANKDWLASVLSALGAGLTSPCSSTPLLPLDDGGGVALLPRAIVGRGERQTRRGPLPFVRGRGGCRRLRALAILRAALTKGQLDGRGVAAHAVARPGPIPRPRGGRRVRARRAFFFATRAGRSTRDARHCFSPRRLRHALRLSTSRCSRAVPASVPLRDVHRDYSRSGRAALCSAFERCGGLRTMSIQTFYSLLFVSRAGFGAAETIPPQTLWPSNDLATGLPRALKLPVWHVGWTARRHAPSCSCDMTLADALPTVRPAASARGPAPVQLPCVTLAVTWNAFPILYYNASTSAASTKGLDTLDGRTRYYVTSLIVLSRHNPASSQRKRSPPKSARRARLLRTFSKSFDAGRSLSRPLIRVTSMTRLDFANSTVVRTRS